jgi:poly(A) polymerase
MALSRERIAQELSRLLLLPDPHFAIRLMVENGIFAPFLPELIPEASPNFAQLVERQSRYNLPASLPSRLLAILPENADVADKVAMRLKFSNRIRIELGDRLRERQPNRGNIRALAYHVGIAAAQDTALLRCSDEEVADCLELIANWTVPEFPIGGGHLIAKGLRAGPIVAKTLKDIEKQWIESDFPDGSELQTIVDQLIAGALSASK